MAVFKEQKKHQCFPSLRGAATGYFLQEELSNHLAPMHPTLLPASPLQALPQSLRPSHSACEASPPTPALHGALNCLRPFLTPPWISLTFAQAPSATVLQLPGSPCSSRRYHGGCRGLIFVPVVLPIPLFCVVGWGFFCCCCFWGFFWLF